MMNKRLLVFLISCFCLCEIIFINSSRTDHSEPRFQFSVASDLHLQPQVDTKIILKWRMQRQGRRLLGKPGSFPPRCTSKCGRCTPCKPVHVPVPPGTPVMAEYYPEAWRCKCGNRLYMP
ncbi:hypothetical protein LIER_03441 [Lithospermum erythrorhizon]|uniref:Epidermal patterning factor-like protein n=1 Tax=Lithospermum erythrorhizon TaxID=34254 RepID=A0AAV3NTW8_LITER